MRGLENFLPKNRSLSHLFKVSIVITTVLALLMAVSPVFARAPARAPQSAVGAPDQSLPSQANNPTRTPAPTPTLLFAETPAPKDSPTPTAYPTTLPSTLIGRLFSDLNSNGMYDEGEGLANVSLNVIDANGITRTASTDLRGGFVLSLPAGATLITVNNATLPSGIVLMSGLNPSLITLLGGTPFSFSLGYRPQVDGIPRPTPTITPTVMPIPSPTLTAILPISISTPIVVGAAVEVFLSSKVNVTPPLTTSAGFPLTTNATLLPTTTVKIGDQIDYTITVKATASYATDVTVSVPIPDGTEYMAGSAWPADERAEVQVPQALRHTMAWRIKPLANGQVFSARFAVRVVVGTGSIVAKASASNASTGQSISSNEVLHKSQPTAVSLMRFEAIPTNNGIKISWQTGAELDTFGFVVYRNLGGSPRASAVLLNLNGLIPAKSETGATYEFEDTTALAGQPYSYWLREIERNNVINEYGPLQASIPIQTAANAVVPSNVMAGGVPVAVPLASSAQNIPVPATPSVSIGYVQPLPTPMVQQQVVVVPTLVAAPDNRRVVVQSQPQPQPLAPTTAPAMATVPVAPAEIAATPEPARPPEDQPVAPVAPQTIIEPTATPVAPPSDVVANVATIAAPSTPHTQQPTTQAKPLTPAAKSSAPIRQPNRPTDRTDLQTNLVEWIIWALVIFVVWFVVAGILGIALGQYLRHR